MSTFDTCSDCGFRFEKIPGYAVWCEACHWNLTPEADRPPTTIFEKYYEQLSERRGRALFLSLSTQDLSQPLPNSTGFLWAQTLAIMVWLGYLSLGLFSLYLLWLGRIYTVALCAGLLGLGVSYFLWPWRKQEQPPEGHEPSAFPELNKLLTTIAARIGAPVPEKIYLSEAYNASVQEMGWRRTPVLEIGLPLWEMLEEHEKIDLLAHELGHLANADPLCTRWIHPALLLLFNAGDLICPEDIFPDLLSGQWFFRSEADLFHAAQLVEIPVKMLLVCVAKMFWGLGHLLLLLVWQESQRAEYRADLFGLKLAGLSKALQGMEKMELATFFYHHAQDSLLKKKPPQDLLIAAHQKWKQLPAKEKQRYRVLMQQEHHRIDATHPPTLFRMQMLEAQKAHFAYDPIPTPHWERLEAELAPYRLPIAEKIYDQLRDNMYV